MKILLITGLLAHKDVVEIANGIEDHEVHVWKVNKPVASLITLKDLKNLLTSRVNEVKDYDLIMVPGLLRHDLTPLAKEFNVNIIKGPKFCGDIPLVIKYIEKGVKFSTSIPADEIIEKQLMSELGKVTEFIESRLSSYLEVSGVKVPIRPPPFRVVYEVNIGRFKDVNELRNYLIKRLNYFDVLVLGIRVDESLRFGLGDAVSVAKSLGKPVGIDSPYIDDVIEALRCGADIAMNIKLNDLPRILEFKDKMLILIPEKVDPKDRLKELTYTYQVFKNEGFTKLVLDPVTHPPLFGLLDTLLMLKDLMNKIDTPILFGLANVYELMDADTHGVIALLTALALECGTSLLLVTEESRKSQGALCELHKAINMVYRSVLRRSPLLNTGIDLLIVKEKRDMKISRPRFKELIKVKVKKSPIEFEPSNYFKILVDDLIYALNFRNNEEVARRAYVGTDGLSIGREIISRGDVKSLDHALYLGYELAKAEIALQLGKNYVQDSKLFRLGECYGR